MSQYQFTAIRILKLLNWMNNLNKTRYAMDILLLIFFLVAAAPHATGIVIHEWVSFVYLIPFIIHLLLHWKWIMNIPKQLFGKLQLGTRINIIWDSLLYLMMIFVTFTGILVSEAALPLLGFTIEPDNFWHLMHHNSSNLLFPMLGIHLALHWTWIVKISKHIFSSKAGEAHE